MKHTLYLLFSLLAVLPCVGQGRRMLLDDDWQFRLDGGEWRRIDLPHDWSVELPFSRESPGTTQTGWTLGGVGHYRKTFTLTPAQQRDSVWLYFEGAYNQTVVYINGREAATNVYGYTSFRVPATPYLRPAGEPQVVEVRVENTGNNSRWYAGSGIYRHVWLLATPRRHLDEWQTQTLYNKEKRTVEVATTVVGGRGTVRARLTDRDGRTVARASQTGTGELRLTLRLATPHLWSPSDPYLYRLRLTLTGGDTLRIPVGLRTLSFSAREGFLLNGVPTLLRGGCVHHDNGLLGAAAWDKAEERKLRLLKAEGFNAVRGSHNMQSEHFLHVCDSLGMMVLDECFDQWLLPKNPDDYHRYFAAHSTADLTALLRRDRNHPCVIMWGLGNEIPGRIEPEGLATAERLRQTVKSLDPTRPVTAAVSGWDAGDAWNAEGQHWAVQDSLAFLSLDVAGYNYLYDKYERDHQTHPERVMCGLESYPKRTAENWALAEAHPYIIGDFVWTAMDYLGEAGIGSAQYAPSVPMFRPWPWFNGWCGDLDLIGEKKPQSYYRDVVWRRRAITLAVEPPHPHESISAWGWQQERLSWTWPELREGDTTTVNVYSRAPRVRLYLGERLVGESATSQTYWAGFRVPYHKGTLRAVCVEHGEETDSAVLTTTGRPHAVRLRADRPAYSATGRDLVYVTAEVIDSAGRVVTSDSHTRLTFSVAGAGRWLTSGTASPTDMASFRSATVNVFEGRALCIVRTADAPGTLTVSCTPEADAMIREGRLTTEVR